MDGSQKKKAVGFGRTGSRVSRGADRQPRTAALEQGIYSIVGLCLPLVYAGTILRHTVKMWWELAPQTSGEGAAWICLVLFLCTIEFTAVALAREFWRSHDVRVLGLFLLLQAYPSTAILYGVIARDHEVLIAREKERLTEIGREGARSKAALDTKRSELRRQLAELGPSIRADQREYSRFNSETFTERTPPEQRVLDGLADHIRRSADLKHELEAELAHLETWTESQPAEDVSPRVPDRFSFIVQSIGSAKFFLGLFFALLPPTVLLGSTLVLKSGAEPESGAVPEAEPGGSSLSMADLLEVAERLPSAEHRDFVQRSVEPVLEPRMAMARMADRHETALTAFYLDERARLRFSQACAALQSEVSSSGLDPGAKDYLSCHVKGLESENLKGG